ncbi:hypothetical protein JHJ32_02205 [Parapedobacter sp. ISTM3]|uniref:Uncharacterized protein n=1 Tax=Parapedobacter luteus TaxID=623280 RepID=A0A1T4ZYT2_9SPHI|nr:MULTISPECIES: hypothetical protein [Parapedobacter]MBK1438787.1 hypothetical protein [Parapedobacter sp. ISTM3]SKB27649.1 hypothetical protein SAMN05660226_00292 [Parapedobacter luteus]
MRQLRITPLNIASALLMTWLLWQIVAEGIGMGTAGWFLLLLLVLVAADQFFRLMLRNLKRVWMAEGVFVLLVVVLVWILRAW